MLDGLYSLAGRLHPRLEGWLRQLLASDFIAKVAQTFAARIAMLVIGLLMSVLISRWLGPTNRGIYAVAVLVSSVGMQFGNLGLHASNTYYVARDRSLLPVLLGNSFVAGLAAGSLIAALVAFLFVFRPDLFPLSSRALALALAAIPLGLFYLLLQNLLLGIQEVSLYNRIEVLSKIGSLLLLLAAIPLHLVTVEALLWISLVVAAGALVFTARKLVRVCASPPRISFKLFKDSLGYGYKAYLAALFSFLVIRADLFLVNYFLGETQSGYYSIAITLADMVYMLPMVIGLILFPRLSAMTRLVEKWAYTRKVTLIVFGLISALSLVLSLVSPWVIRLLYGEAFLPSSAAFVWLLPAIVFLSTNTMLMNFFASIGMPRITIYSPFAALAVNILLNWLLIPRLGIVGASLSSVGAYGLMLILSMSYIARNKLAYGTELPQTAF